MSAFTGIKATLARQQGYAMVGALIAATIISGLGVVMMNRATASVRQQQFSVEQDQSWYLAMAGIEHCMANLRWKAGIWEKIMITDTATPAERTCSGSLNGGSYSAEVFFHEPGKARIASTGSHGRASRTLTGIVAWGSMDPKDNEGSVIAGGDWRFNGSTSIKGALATTGSMDLVSKSVKVCGQLYAAGTVTYNAANLVTDPACGTITPQSGVTGIKLYDDTMTLNAVMASPAHKYTGNLTCPSASCNMNYSSVYVTGTLTFKGDYTFPRNNTVIVANKIEFVSPAGTVSAPPSAAKPAVYLYTVPGSEGSLTCDAIVAAHPPPTKAAYTRVEISSNYVISNVTFWFKTGLFAPSSNVSIKGKIYGQCVETSSSFTFEPGSAAGPDSDVGGLPGPASYADSLWLLSLY